MLKISLRITNHKSKPEVKIVEILEDGKGVVGAIYPIKKGLKIISRYLVDDPEKVIKIDRLPPPAILINLLKE